ncbi:MAG TPA: hypothetical protein VHT91_07915 [Kofleriaceae bacterium]|nr:hypothetical protein [Kofleriaceae bacterium]
MTSGLLQTVESRARALQARLNHLDVTASAAATEAIRIFDDAGDDVRRRWLTLELDGYAEHIDARALHEVLGVPHGHRLVAHVTAYRTQRGVDATPGRRPAEFRHFFIEPLSALEATRDKVAASAGGAAVLLDFGPHPRDAHYPTVGEFTRAVFDRVIAGFQAALHLQLGALTT